MNVKLRYLFTSILLVSCTLYLTFNYTNLLNPTQQTKNFIPRNLGKENTKTKDDADPKKPKNSETNKPVNKDTKPAKADPEPEPKPEPSPEPQPTPEPKKDPKTRKFYFF